MPEYFGEISEEFELDYYDFFLQQGVTYFIELEGTATFAGDLSDPYMTLLENWNPPKYDDDGGVGYNARIIFTPDVSDFYTLEVGGLGGDTGSYRLRVNPDDYRGSVEGLGARGVVGNTRSPLTGEIDYFGDRDIFSTQLISGLTYTFTQRGQPTGHGTLAESALRLLDGADQELAYNDIVNGIFNASIVYRAQYTGAYFLQAGSYQDDFMGSYEINVGAGRATIFNDVVNGTVFADAINGLQGVDNIRGGNGSDFLYGAQHGDTLRGQSGYDSLHGGRGADILIGGIHSDTFVYGGALDSTPASFDRIRAGDNAAAFQLPGGAGGDVIDLWLIDANTTRPGNQAFTFNSTAVGGLSLVNSGPNTLVRGNLDSDAAFEFTIRIEDGAVGSGAYSRLDFLL